MKKTLLILALFVGFFSIRDTAFADWWNIIPTIKVPTINLPTNTPTLTPTPTMIKLYINPDLFKGIDGPTDAPTSTEATTQAPSNVPSSPTITPTSTQEKTTNAVTSPTVKPKATSTPKTTKSPEKAVTTGVVNKKTEGAKQIDNKTVIYAVVIALLVMVVIAQAWPKTKKTPPEKTT
ncbi:hypothetical protein B6D29_03690 [Microgenomates bacterium UTCPR1]|nr:MAG: hypothetical protein B6D29_03690 [Microgenomates bacterium UTCPR1]